MSDALPVRDPADLIAVIDIGKTHARLITADADGRVLASEQSPVPPPNAAGAVQELNVRAVERWLLTQLHENPFTSRIRTLIPVAHGAAAALLDQDQQLITVPDYEDARFETIADPYRARRDAFERTFSPFLPMGLNLGRQLFYLSERVPNLYCRARHLLFYPQYWAWRFCGELASEYTSLGCHTDLWRPLERRLSDLSMAQGWAVLLPALRAAGDSLGSITRELAEATGLSPDCRVLCGLHDSSAAFLAHGVAWGSRPFTVISSGTWTILMTRQASLLRLREDQDMLVNLSTQGEAVATARFMGGREYAEIAGDSGLALCPSREDLSVLFARTALALPSFSPAGGPFARNPGRLLSAEGLNDRQRVTLATLYLALMTDYCLEALDAQGEIIIDGPLAHNTLYGELLVQLLARNAVHRVRDACPGAVAAATYLAGHRPRAHTYAIVTVTERIPGLAEYRNAWRGCLPSLPNSSQSRG